MADEIKGYIFEKIKALGWAPFHSAEIHVSMRKKVARLVFLVPARKSNHRSMVFPIDDGLETFSQAGRMIIKTASMAGLLEAGSIVAVVDADAGPVQ
jgi:hypothetical protein